MTDKSSALIEAVKREDVAAVRAMLAQGANPNAADARGTTPLMVAAFKHRRKLLLTLIRAGADVNARDRSGATALMKAAVFSKRKVVQALIDNGADVNAKTHDGRTALIEAAGGGDRQRDNVSFQQELTSMP